ncbi:MAG TPA: glycosyltransferase family 4 protein [Roseiarcus sp.]|nr:glycosyltransferase family 4 protein [Roseiarcus sp.]
MTLAPGAIRPGFGVRQRVLVLTHSHPKITRGGAEIAAGSLVRALRASGEVEAFLLGCSSKPETERLGLSLTQPFAEQDFVYQAPSSFDHFKFANRDAKFPKILLDLLDEIKPDIVHFHHYTVFGVEAFAIIKRNRPEAKIVLTLHEFLAICLNHGQMVKTKSLQLCDAESPMACSRCFPELGPRDFFLRKAYIRTFLDYVDLFISPSQFLADRYIEWGLPRDKLIVLENVPPELEARPAPTERSQAQVRVRPVPSVKWSAGRRRPIRIGLFGQLSPLKGIKVLLDAAKELAANKIENVRIEIFGDYSSQPLEFQKAVIDALGEVSANVRFHGPYDNSKVHRLMRAVDAVLVPSIWWENSPVVIQEALTNRRPVICSDIGGMAEAVRPGLDGLWFSVGDSMSLAEVLMEVSRSPEILTSLEATLRRPRPVEAVARAHMEAYRAIGAPK